MCVLVWWKPRCHHDFAIESARHHSVGGISCNGVVGPVFIDGTIDSHRYLDMLTDVKISWNLFQIPILTSIILFGATTVKPAEFVELYFQQHGAPSPLHLLWTSVDSCTRHYPIIGLDDGEILSGYLVPLGLFLGVVKDIPENLSQYHGWRISPLMRLRTFILNRICVALCEECRGQDEEMHQRKVMFYFLSQRWLTSLMEHK